MKQLTYEERVQAIAEKMFRDDEGLKQDSRISKLDWIISGDLYMRRARIAVAEMAEAYEWGHHDGWMSKAMNFNRLDSPSLREGKIKSGLIPDDGQEGLQDA